MYIGCEILVKAEFLNCGGSVKDRAALFLIKNAEEKGQYEKSHKQTASCKILCDWLVKLVIN